MSKALPLVGLAAGTTMMVLGSSQLTAAWFATDIPKSDKWKHGLFAGGFVALGTILQALSSYELAEAMSEDQ